MRHLEANTMNDLYPELVQACRQHGYAHQPRGLACYELRPASFSLAYPHDSLYLGSARKLNFRFWAVEFLGYLAGTNAKWYMDLLVDTNKQYEKFRNPVGGLEGAYGPVLKKSLTEAANLLTRDPDSRQAVVSLWSPGIDDKVHCNTMCTCLLHFYRTPLRVVPGVEENLLSLSVYMRSNDLNWGTAYDVPAFCALQLVMASVLGWGVGSYNHTAGSLHLYEAHPPSVNGLGDFYLDFLRIPEASLVSEKRRAGDLMSDMQTRALNFLMELSNHRLAGGKWSEFETTMEQKRRSDFEYWRYWATMVRFSWSNAKPSVVGYTGAHGS